MTGSGMSPLSPRAALAGQVFRDLSGCDYTHGHICDIDIRERAKRSPGHPQPIDQPCRRRRAMPNTPASPVAMSTYVDGSGTTPGFPG